MAVTVLVVDDASFVRDLIKRTLRKLLPNANLLEAQNGSRAQALMRQHRIDLILSDWEMPEVSGEELLHWVRQNEATAAIPFVMITSRGDRNHVLQAVNAGVNDYLTKPFTADELTRKLLKQCKRAGIPTAAPKERSVQQSAFDSVGVLTGSPSPAPDAGRPQAEKQSVKPAAAFAPPTSKAKSLQGSFSGSAVLRFAGASGTLDVRDISLQAISGFISRELGPPALFEQAAVDLELDDGQTLARINAYVHTLQAAQPSADCNTIKIGLRFVDKDPAKLEALSKCLTRR